MAANWRLSYARVPLGSSVLAEPPGRRSLAATMSGQAADLADEPIHFAARQDLVQFYCGKRPASANRLMTGGVYGYGTFARIIHY
jgi:hypothetical protein